MKPVYFVFNVAKTAVDPENGLLVGPGQLQDRAGYSVVLHTDREAAQKQCDNFARGGSAGAIFELTEIRVVKPVPVEVLTLEADRS